MTVLVSDSQVRAHYSMPMCIDAVERAFAAAGGGGFEISERKVVGVDDKARLLSLTAASSTLEALVAHIYTGAPPGHGKRSSPVNKRQKLYAVFSAATGECQALIGGAYLAWLKTGAMGAVGIKHLSRPDSASLAILGAGRQARSALLGAVEVRDFEDIRVWSRTEESASKLVTEFHDLPGIRTTRTARGAVEGADVVITVTTATSPILLGEWLSPGTHVNSVGAHYPKQRELDGEAISRSTVVVDSMVTARAEKGELLIAEEEGLFSFDRVVAELGEVVAGTAPWQRRDEEITVFASCGSAIEAVGAATGVLATVPESDRQVFVF